MSEVAPETEEIEAGSQGVDISNLPDDKTVIREATYFTRDRILLLLSLILIAGVAYQQKQKQQDLEDRAKTLVCADEKCESVAEAGRMLQFLAELSEHFEKLIAVGPLIDLKTHDLHLLAPAELDADFIGDGYSLETVDEQEIPEPTIKIQVENLHNPGAFIQINGNRGIIIDQDLNFNFPGMKKYGMVQSPDCVNTALGQYREACSARHLMYTFDIAEDGKITNVAVQALLGNANHPRGEHNTTANGTFLRPLVYKQQVNDPRIIAGLEKALASYESFQERLASRKSFMEAQKWAMEAFEPNPEEIEYFSKRLKQLIKPRNQKALGVKRTEKRNGINYEYMDYMREEWVDDDLINELSKGFARICKVTGIKPSTLRKRLKVLRHAKFIFTPNKDVRTSGYADYPVREIAIFGPDRKKLAPVTLHEIFHYIISALGAGHCPPVEEGLVENFTHIAYPDLAEPVYATSTLYASLLNVALDSKLYTEIFKRNGKFRKLNSRKCHKNGKYRKRVMTKLVEQWGINDEADKARLVEILSNLNNWRAVGPETAREEFVEGKSPEALQELQEILLKHNLQWTTLLEQVAPVVGSHVINWQWLSDPYENVGDHGVEGVEPQ